MGLPEKIAPPAVKLKLTRFDGPQDLTELTCNQRYEMIDTVT
jgi:hypothetical protein